MEENKENRLAKFIVTIFVTMLVLGVIGLITFKFISKEGKLETNNINNTQDTEERKNRIEEEIRKREEKIEEIKKSKNYQGYSYLSSISFIRYLENEGLIDYDKDTVLGNRVTVGNNNYDIVDYKIDENGNLISYKKNEIQGDTPNIMFTGKGIYDNENNYITKVSYDGKASFDPLYIDNEPIVVAMDKKDGDITNNLKVTYSEKPENWKPGNVYKVTYEVTNSNGKTAKNTLNVKLLDLMKGKK